MQQEQFSFFSFFFFKKNPLQHHLLDSHLPPVAAAKNWAMKVIMLCPHEAQ